MQSMQYISAEDANYRGLYRIPITLGKVIMKFKQMSDKEFFTKLIDAAEHSYQENCIFNAEKEGLTKYEEPDYEAAIQHAKTRIEKMSPDN